MATTTSQIRSVITDLYDLLAVRGGLSGVPLFRYAPSEKDTTALREYITIATRVTGEQEFPAATNKLKYDTFTLYGVVYTSTPAAGDDVADVAHARAEALLAEIEDEVRADPSIGRSDTEVQLGIYEHTYGANETGRWHVLAFQLDCRTRNVST